VAVADLIGANFPKVAKPSESVLAPRPVEMTMGGHACNVSADLVQLGLPADQVTTIISIKKDFFGKFILNKLKPYGINIKVLEAPAPTSTDLIIVVKREDRRFHPFIGANLYLDPDYVRKILEEEKPKLFYIGAAGGLGKFDDKIGEVCKKAKNLGAIIFTDAVIPFKKGWNYIVPHLKYMDLLHVNNVEAASLTGKKDPLKALNKIADYGVKIAVISMGIKGSMTHVDDKIFKASVMKVESVDPTGAGDAFCTGLILKLLEKQITTKTKLNVEKLGVDDIKELLAYASAAGAACVTAVGTTTAVKPPVVDKILKEQKDSFIKSVEVESRKLS